MRRAAYPPFGFLLALAEKSVRFRFHVLCDMGVGRAGFRLRRTFHFVIVRLSLLHIIAARTRECVGGQMSALNILSHHHSSLALALALPGMSEWIVILVIVLLLFGPGKLPMVGEALGRSIKSFKRAISREDEIDVTPPQLEEPTEQVAANHDQKQPQSHSVS